MRLRGAAVLLLAGLALIIAGRADGAEPVSFSREVLPILTENCFLCHGPDAKTRKANLRLDVRESALREKDPIIVPGKSGESELIDRLLSHDPETVMPPARSGKKLSPEQIKLLTRWVDEGARWGKHWAFEPIGKPEPPRVRDESWVRNPIDRFVLARLEAEGLKPSAEADKVTLIRRLSLDLTGLPPAPAEVDAFLADTSPGAYDSLVDRLLRSPRYGERMAMDWLDDARYADTNGFQNDFARTMWPWRDWVIDAFNRNQPFDQFIVEQVAGDLLPNSTLAQKIATGFNRNNRTVTEAGSIDEEWRIENAVDRVETTATVFLGLTMGCARCHDHKYDPVTQQEFYEFLGFFNSINEKGVYTETRGNVPPLVAVPSPDDQQQLRALDAQIAAADERVKREQKALPDRQKHWEEEQRGKPLPPEPSDWALRAELDECLHLFNAHDALHKLEYANHAPPQWAEGPLGNALRLDGSERSYATAKDAPSLERGEKFSYGAWVKWRGAGAVLSKMDVRDAYRGFDLLVDHDKVAVHLIHAWPGDALKVITKQTIPRDRWTHLICTYDGSGKASGVAMYIDGRRADLDVETDSLKGSIATREPFRLGRRSTEFFFNGDVADVRIYRRVLGADEVKAIGDRPVLELARTPAADRTKTEADLLARVYRERFASELLAATGAAARLRQEKSALEQRIPTVMVMEDQPKARDLFLLKRGRYDMPDTSKKLSPGVPACLPAMAPDAPRNRLGLARWLVAPENPLTSRVTVNRYWQHHFGTGLVKTTENFGRQSELPTHPALLDWLAGELIRTGWDLKALHRQIVSSATYRQSSKATAALVHRDPENRLLARGPRYRLPAEVVRDNALAIAGLLVAKVGGPSIKPYQPAGLWEELAGGAGEGPYVQDKGPALYRRSLYIYRKRTVPHPAMANFDAPSREICQVKRARTNTPLQALELLNDVTYVEAARHLAERMLTEGGNTAESRITYAFRRATGRAPSALELKVAIRGLDRYRDVFGRDRDAAARLLKNGESPVAPSLDAAELAAYTTAAGVILNLDETITLE